MHLPAAGRWKSEEDAPLVTDATQAAAARVRLYEGWFDKGSCLVGGIAGEGPVPVIFKTIFASSRVATSTYFGCGTMRIYGLGAFQPCG